MIGLRPTKSISWKHVHPDCGQLRAGHILIEGAEDIRGRLVRAGRELCRASENRTDTRLSPESVLSFVELSENLRARRPGEQLGDGFIESNVLAMTPDELHWCAETIRLLWIEVIEGLERGRHAQ